MISPLGSNRRVFGVVGLGAARESHPHIPGRGADGILKAVRHHTDHGELPTVKREGAPDHIAIGVEVLAPEAIAQNHYVVTGVVLGVEKSPAK